jgi:hypothetical protein
MNRLLIAATLLVLAAMPALAAGHKIPAKSELAVSGTYVKPRGEAAVYSFDGQLAVPLNGGGNILLGPQIHYDSDDSRQAAGAVLEVNFLGTNHSGPFVGLSGLYSLKDSPGVERYSLDGLAGVKLQVGKGGFVKVYAERAVGGRDKDIAQTQGVVGLGLRF